LDSSHGEAQGNNRKQEISLELLHAIVLGGKRDRVSDHGTLLSSGVLDSVMALLGSEKAGMLSKKMTHLGLDIVEFVISDIDPRSPAVVKQFTNVMASQEWFLKTLIATMVATNKDISQKKISAPPLYGAPLHDASNKAPSTVGDKAINLLFNISSLMCNDDGNSKAHFLHAFMLKDVHGATSKTVALAACIFLEILMDEDDGICVPRNTPVDRSFFLDIQLPMIRSQLLECLSQTLDECMAASSDNSREHAETLIVHFRIPQMCLLNCQSNKVFEESFQLYENVVVPLPTDVIGDLLLAEKSSLVALLDLVTGGRHNSVQHVAHYQETFALTLGHLAKDGLLSAAVARFGVRNKAIAALSAAMQGSNDGNIDENEDSLDRICIESLVAILSKGEQGNELDITALEARILASAIGKILSLTVLNRFITQVNYESTFDHSIDHSTDRSAISQSSEARLLCSLASFPEGLSTLKHAGGLEAISLIAHEGELDAIRAIQKACEISPSSVIDVDAHLSIMDALTQVEFKINTNVSDLDKLREVTAQCLQIITALSQNTKTRPRVISAEQSSGCVTVALRIISARSKLLMGKEKGPENFLSDVTKVPNVPTTAKTGITQKITTSLSSSDDRLQLGDLVFTESSPSDNNSSPKELEGIVAHLGTVQFAPGDDWIGIRLTGACVGLGRNDGTVKGVHYFDCEDNGKNGVFVKSANVKKQDTEVEPDAKEDIILQEEVMTEDSIIATANTQQEDKSNNHDQLWGRLLSKENFDLERASFSLLQSFSSSKSLRNLLMNAGTAIDDMSSVILLCSSELIDFQCIALDLLASLTLHLSMPDAQLTKLFCSVVESRTKVLQTSRDKRFLNSTKQLLSSAIGGLETIFLPFMDADEQSRSLVIISDLFIFLTDSLFKGPKSRRLSVSSNDAALFWHLTSFLLLSLGSESFRTSILSNRKKLSQLISSLSRFIMMTAGVGSLDCQISILDNRGGDQWNAALSQCLFCLSCNMVTSLQDRLGISYASLIEETEISPKAFQSCLRHIVDEKCCGASSISAKQILVKLERCSE